jgi:hypothetical protein
LCDQNRHIVGYARSRDARKGASSSVAGATDTAMTPSPVKPLNDAVLLTYGVLHELCEALHQAEQARADAVREDARRAKMRDNAEARRLIAQTYDDAFRSFGVTTPEPADDEAPSAFRKRLFNRLARKLPPDHDLAQLRADDLGSQPIVFDNFETELIKAATAEGASPSFENLPDDGSLVARHRTDSATGERMTEFFGRESFIKSMGRDGRKLLHIKNPASGAVLWGRALETAPTFRR